MTAPGTGRGGKVFRCAVHGDIELSPDEVSLLDTEEMQRLRGIKQLGTASLVYPSAVHSRFEHSLGTLHMAEALCARLPAGALDAEGRRVVRAAALLHDVTHIPYGHTLEDERRLFPRHDRPERTRRFLRGGELGERLARQGRREAVEAAVTGEAPIDRAPPGGAATGAVPTSDVPTGDGAAPLLHDILAATIGADVLDYLLRDAFFCGLRRRYDERILRYVTAGDDRAGRCRLVLQIGKRGRVRADAISEILHVLRLRTTLCERVYFHHAKVAAGAMLSKAVERALEGGLTLDRLFRLTDGALLAALGSEFAEDPAIARLSGAVERRHLFKRAYMVTRAIGPQAQAALVSAYHESAPRRAEAEADLAGAVGLQPEEVIVYCPEPRMALKEADIPVRVGDGAPVISLADLGLAEVDELLERHRALWRFYVLVAPWRMDRAAALAEASAGYFGRASQLRAGGGF